MQLVLPYRLRSCGKQHGQTSLRRMLPPARRAARGPHLGHLWLREQHVAHLLAPHRLRLVLRRLALGAALRGQLCRRRLVRLALLRDGLLELQTVEVRGRGRS